MNAKKRTTVSDKRQQLGKKLPVVVPLQSVLDDKDRLTMTFNLHHEQKGESPRSVEAIYQEFLTKHIETYTRSVSVTEKWAPIVDDSCWISSDLIRVIVVQNKEGVAHRQLNPTNEEKEEISKKVVELSYDRKYSDLVTPGFTLPKTPGNGAILYARCQSGTASCRITVVPK